MESVTNDRLDEEIEHPFIMFDQVRCQKVFYIFSMQNKFRQLCYRIVLRLLRTLRPLRFNQNMKLVVTALLESLGVIVNVVIVVLIIWLMFAILAVNIVGGKMGVCASLPSGISKYGIVQSKCINMGYSWNVPDINFDYDRDYSSKNKVAKEVTQMNLLLDPDGMLFFNDVLFGTYKRAYETDEIIANSD